MGQKNSQPCIQFTVVSLKHDSIETIRRKIHHACKTLGFFIVIDHGLEQQAEEMFQRSKDFFNVDIPTKSQLTNRSNHFRVGIGCGYDNLLKPKNENSDCKECYAVYGPENDIDRFWVKEEVLPGFMNDAHQFYNNIHKLALSILEHMAIAQNREPGFYTKAHTSKNSNSTLRFHRYPAQEIEREGVGPHSDWGTITLLWQDEIGGLYVYDYASKLWYEAMPMKGALFVNCGDLMNKWYSEYISVPHRVRTRPHKDDRYSIAFFMRPDRATIIQDKTAEEFACTKILKRSTIDKPVEETHKSD